MNNRPASAARRIAVVAASMRMGGAERMTLNLAAEFARRGHLVDLVLIDSTGPLLERVPANVRIVGLGGKRARQVVLKLRTYIKRVRPDALLSIAFHTNILTMLATVGLDPKPRIVLSVRNNYSATRAALSWPRRLMLDLATRLLYPRADAVSAISAGCAEDIQRNARLKPESVVTIYNPVIDGEFDQMAAAPADPPLALSKGEATILTVGRLAAQKDQATLLQAFAKVVRARPARLVLIGEGEQRATLETLAAELGIADRVIFAGLRDNPYPHMRNADLFVLSSSWEGFGNVLVEAMATGTPVVSTDCPHGPREILDHGKWGALVPPGDTGALAEAMIETLRTGGIDARQRAQQFSVARSADKYLGVMLGRSKRSKGKG